MFDDPYEMVHAIADLKTRKFKTSGVSKPFQVLSIDEDGLTLRTSAGGKISLRMEVFQVAEQLLRDLSKDDSQGWVLLGDPTLELVLRGQNRDKACSSYVFPLLEAAGRVEIARGRPTKLRLIQSGAAEAKAEKSAEPEAS